MQRLLNPKAGKPLEEHQLSQSGQRSFLRNRLVESSSVQVYVEVKPGATITDMKKERTDKVWNGKDPSQRLGSSF